MNERPSWLDWNGVVELAETLATNKGMLRVDIYVGRPAQETGWFESGARRKHPSFALSECEVHPTTVFYVIQPFLRRPLDHGWQVIRLEIIVLFQAIKSQKSFSRLECCLRTVSCTGASFRPRIN